jgi:hypothetical protein
MTKKLNKLVELFSPDRKEKLKKKIANQVDMDFCGLTIQVDKATLKKFQTWKKKVEVPIEELGAIGGEFTYQMTPTSIGVIYVVEHSSGEKFDLTNYDLW